MQEDTLALYELAESTEVRRYLNRHGDASVHVHEGDAGSFLYVQKVGEEGPQRSVLAYREDGELYSPDEISDDHEFTEELGGWLLGHGDVTLDESVLERTPRFV